MRRGMIIPAAIFLWMGVFAAHGATAGGNLPTISILGSLSKVYEPVRFNHAEHVSLAGGCGDCHHQHRSLQLQTCSECHRFDPAPFKKNILTDKLLPCRDCHPASETPGSTEPSLKVAYHRACLKCHWGDVGSAGKNLEGCTEMCHALKIPGNREKKK